MQPHRNTKERNNSYPSVKRKNYLINKSGAGFTIFESLIYIALFTVVIGGGVLSAYNVFDGSADIKAKAQREMEINFVQRKFDWALSGSAINSPSAGSPPSNELQVNKDGGSTYRFHVDGSTDTLFMDNTSNGTTFPLTSDQLNITNITFDHVAGTPNVMHIGIEIDGAFLGTTTRYVRTN